jgi:hypothetical protein
MAKRRQVDVVQSDVLPAHLVAQWKSPELWLDDNESKPPHASELWFAHQARRRFAAARRAFLSNLEVKPKGVGDLEWHAAHGRGLDVSTHMYRPFRQEQNNG